MTDIVLTRTRVDDEEITHDENGIDIRFLWWYDLQDLSVAPDVVCTPDKKYHYYHDPVDPAFIIGPFATAEEAQQHHDTAAETLEDVDE